MQYLELTKSEKDFTALKSQSEGLSKEYDRLLEEYTQTKVCKMEFFLLLESFFWVNHLGLIKLYKLTLHSFTSDVKQLVSASSLNLHYLSAGENGPPPCRGVSKNGTSY